MARLSTKAWLWIAAGLGVLWYMTKGGGLQSLIEGFEGLSLVPYQDTAGNWTIGYGHLIKPTDPYYPYGPVKEITQAQADALLQADMQPALDAVEEYVTVPLTQNQKDALTDFVYNVGVGNFQSSTLLSLLNQGDYTGAAAEFSKWIFAGGVVAPGLEARRAAEAVLFLA